MIEIKDQQISDKYHMQRTLPAPGSAIHQLLLSVF